MKKILILLGILFVAAMSLGLTLTVKAGGDKVRGEKGEGNVNQVFVTCEEPDCLFPWEDPALNNWE